MQKSPDLAKNLQELFDGSSYTEFQPGAFIQRPDMFGYYFIFKNITDPKFCVILNMNKENPYPSNMSQIKDFVFIVFNINSLEEYLENMGTYYLSIILDVLEQKLQKKNTRNLPYGYYVDENGDLKVDIKKANEVRKIYNRYIETESVRQIAAEMRTNFSFIRDILHDNEEYAQMQEKILPTSKIKKVNELLASNVKGAFRKITMADKLKEYKRKRKEREKLQKVQQ